MYTDDTNINPLASTIQSIQLKILIIYHLIFISVSLGPKIGNNCYVILVVQNHAYGIHKYLQWTLNTCSGDISTCRALSTSTCSGSEDISTCSGEEWTDVSVSLSGQCEPCLCWLSDPRITWMSPVNDATATSSWLSASMSAMMGAAANGPDDNSRLHATVSSGMQLHHAINQSMTQTDAGMSASIFCISTLQRDLRHWKLDLAY